MTASAAAMSIVYSVALTVRSSRSLERLSLHAARSRSRDRPVLGSAKSGLWRLRFSPHSEPPTKPRQLS